MKGKKKNIGKKLTIAEGRKTIIKEKQTITKGNFATRPVVTAETGGNGFLNDNANQFKMKEILRRTSDV